MGIEADESGEVGHRQVEWRSGSSTPPTECPNNSKPIDPLMREVVEIRHQFDQDYVIDVSATTA